MAFATLLYDKRDGIAHVVLNRPQVLNALNVQMRDDLSEVLLAVQRDDEVEVVLFSGAGRAYCAGADVTEFGSAPSPIAARRIRFERDNWGALAFLEKPSIAAMHGYAFGSGLELAMLCDIRIAAEGTMFGLPELPLGMIPAAGGTQTIGRVTLPGHALPMFLTGARINAKEAYRIGLVNRVVPANDLMKAAKEIAHRLMSNAPLAVRMAKRAVLFGMDSHINQGMALEQTMAATISQTRDFRVGLRARLAGRTPRFAGR